MDGHPHDTALANEVARVRRRIEDAMRVLAEADMHLPMAEELRSARPAQRDAELLNQYRIKLEVALKDAAGWAVLFSRAAERVVAEAAGGRDGSRDAWHHATAAVTVVPSPMLPHPPLDDASAAISPSRLNVSA